MLHPLIYAALALIIASPAAAVTKVAVVPFDFHDAQQDGEMFPQHDPNDLQRLKLIADELRSLMEKDERYQVVDLSGKAQEIDAASPFYKCDGCEVPIAKEAGADVVVTGYVDKLSNALIQLQLVERNVATGELTKTMSASINGNTDELWLHGLKYLWRNRFSAEAQAK